MVEKKFVSKDIELVPHEPKRLKGRSVFEKHPETIELYSARGDLSGRLFTAVSILSDVQEMSTRGQDVNEEVNEAKELIINVQRNLEKMKEVL